MRQKRIDEILAENNIAYRKLFKGSLEREDAINGIPQTDPFNYDVSFRDYNSEGAYFKWTAKDEQKITEPIEWDSLFELSPLFDDKNADSISISAQPLMREFRTVRWNKDANQMKADLEVNKQSKLTDAAFTKASNLRDELQKRLDVIHKDIDLIDKEIIQVLKVWYYETMESIKREAKPEKRENSIEGLNHFAKLLFTMIRKGVNLNHLAEKSIPMYVDDLGCTPKMVRNSTYNGVLQLAAKKVSKYETMAKLFKRWMLYRRAVNLHLVDKPVTLVIDENGKPIVPNLELESNSTGNPNFSKPDAKDIQKVVKKANELLKSKPETYKPIKENAYLSNSLKNEIADQLNMAETTVSDWLKKYCKKENGYYKAKTAENDYSK